jgi:hypothetical protein
MLLFVDDIIVFSSKAGEHALRLENVMHRFDDANLQLRPGKCVFAKSQVLIWASRCEIRVLQHLLIRL